MEVEMKIRGLMMDPVTNMPIVVLKDANGSAVLPIWVGVYEANAIALEIEKVQTPRPMTHDLLKNVLFGLNVQVQKVVVNELRDDTFYALIWVERNGERMSIDSRPERRPGAGPARGLPDLRRGDGAQELQDFERRQREVHQRRAAQVARRPLRRRPRPLQDVTLGSSAVRVRSCQR